MAEFEDVWLGWCCVTAAMLWPQTGRADRRTSRRVYVRGVIAAHVEPRISTHHFQLEPSPLASTAVSGGAIEDAGVRVNGSTSPTAIVGYVLPGMPWQLSVETVLGAPSTLKIEATGRLASESIAPEAAGVATGIPPLGRDLAEAAMTAPIVSAIVRPLRVDRVTVFGGLGASVLLVYDEKVTNPVLTEVAAPKLAIAHAFGAVVQAGVEARIWSRIVVRIDAKYIWYREARATIDDIEVRTEIPRLPTVEVGSARMDVTVRPIIFQCGIGADF